MPRRLEGRTAVITGGSSGIGRAIALAFAEAGADVAVSCRASVERAQIVAEQARALGVRAAVLQTDLSRTSACEQLVRDAYAFLGRIDIWVNNAGADVLTTEAAGWSWERKLDLLLAVDLKGSMACCYAVADKMRAQESGGGIINMSWDHVTHGMAGENPELFSAVKGGVLSYSKSLARSLAPRIRVNVLAPGWIETSFGENVDREFYAQIQRDTPLGRWGRPEDVAAAAVYLAAPESAFVTGQVLNVNGGVV